MPDLIDPTSASILIVDDDVTVIRVLAKTLAAVGRVRYAVNGADALRLALQEPPDLILLDAEMPGMSGFEVLSTIRTQPTLEHIPTIFITSLSGEDMEEKGLASGAADFIGKPFRPAIVAARVKTQLRLKLAMDRLRTLSSIDALTGVANRRTLDESLMIECKRARRSRTPLSVLMLDVGHFKRFNDTYGHGAGDDALIAVAGAMRACTNRPADLPARYGGEEFALILPNTDGAGAMTVATSLMANVAQLKIAHVASATGFLTVSIGIGCFDKESAHWANSPEGLRDVGECSPSACANAMLTTADQALYSAKASGRAVTVLKRFDGLMPE
ncbi:MAG: diguanylate cyclase [Burkholderiaceae bacterium]|nr:diguanylate cyclase [Burkholderiaceae bacterium]